MEQQVLFDIFGWIASIGLILGYLPQAIQTIRTRNTDGISMPAFKPPTAQQGQSPLCVT